MNRNIDRLGMLRASIARLQEEAKLLEDAIKASGSDYGTYWQATVSTCTTRRTNWKAVANTLHPSHQLVAAHTTVGESVRLTLTSRRAAA